jgi:hypothetical protein
MEPYSIQLCSKDCLHPSKTSKKVYYSLIHDPSRPHTTKNSTPQGTGDLTMEGRRSTNSPFLSHIQHQSTTITCYFIGFFSRVGGCPSKKRCFQRELISPNTLPQKSCAIMRYTVIVEWSNFKLPPLEGSQQSLSPPPYLNLKEYNKLKNEAKTSTSRS